MAAVAVGLKDRADVFVIADRFGLLGMLRDSLRLHGSKNACEQGECGSCSVILDGELVCSCLVLAPEAAGFVRHVEFDVAGTLLEGAIRPGQAFGVIPPGQDHRGKPHSPPQVQPKRRRRKDEGQHHRR